MFQRTWRFRPAAGREAEFERVYGEDGEWASLLKRGRGYLGTDFRRADDGSGEYLTVDRWQSREAWEQFLLTYEREYDSLDRRCEALTDGEWFVSEGTLEPGQPRA